MGPIVDVRAVERVTPPDRPDLKGVFAVELRQQRRNAEDLAAKKASRGLEEDGAEEDAAREEDRGESAGVSNRTISFFA